MQKLYFSTLLIFLSLWVGVKPAQSGGPENLNPALEAQPPRPVVKPSPTVEEPPQESFQSSLESLNTDFSNTQDSYGQRNQFIQTTAKFKLPNERKFLLKTGSNSFIQPKFDEVTNIPIQIGWLGKVRSTTIQAKGGVDLFNRLPGAIHLNLTAERQITPKAKLSFEVDQAPYKANAQTLENGISAWRYGPNLYWQINPKTSLFSMYRRGNYSDRNTENQSFSRLEHRMGKFTIAANLFTWNYARDMQQRKGYFSPRDFLLYNGELAWQGDIFKFLSCHLSGTLGRQRLNGEMTSGNNYRAACTVKFSPKVEADLGYTFSTERNRETGANSSSSRVITGQLRLRF